MTTTESKDTPVFKGICYVFQSVPDVAAACAFFEQRLGFKLHTNLPDVKGLAAGSGYLILHQDEPNFRATTRGAGAHVCIEVTNVDGYHATLRQRGVEVGPIRDQPWGQRDFYLTDPNGYSWCFAQSQR